MTPKSAAPFQNFPSNFRLMRIQLGSFTEYLQASGSVCWKLNSSSSIFLSLGDVQARNLECSLLLAPYNNHCPPCWLYLRYVPPTRMEEQEPLCEVHRWTPARPRRGLWPLRGALTSSRAASHLPARPVGSFSLRPLLMLSSLPGTPLLPNLTLS